MKFSHVKVELKCLLTFQKHQKNSYKDAFKIKVENNRKLQILNPFIFEKFNSTKTSKQLREFTRQDQLQFAIKFQENSYISVFSSYNKFIKEFLSHIHS